MIISIYFYSRLKTCFCLFVVIFLLDFSQASSGINLHTLQAKSSSRYSNARPYHESNHFSYNSEAANRESRSRIKRSAIETDFAIYTPGPQERIPHLSFEYPDYQASCDEDVPIDTVLLTANLKSSAIRAKGKEEELIVNADQVEIEVNDESFTAKFHGSRSVNIITKNRLDFDDNGGFYMFVLNLRNKTTGEIAAATIRIHTKNTNDEAPRFTQEIYKTNVDENAQKDALVATVVATDKDGDTISYSFAPGNPDYNMFHLDTKGVIRLSPSFIQFEKDNYELEVLATDDGSCCEKESPLHTSTASVIVTIIDLNDNKPIFEECSKYNASIEENKPRGTHLINVKAIDRDRGLNGKVEYSIVEMPGQKGRPFDIDKTSGEVTTNMEFDRERDKVISLTVKATDKGNPPLEGLCTILVQILDVNDNDPVFERPGYEEIVPLYTKIGDKLFRLSATDDDLGENAQIQYSFDPEQEHFDLNEKSGVVTLKKDLEKKKYRFKAIATDKGKPPRSARAYVIIDVTSENINPPEWDKQNYTVEIKENVEINTEVLTVTAKSKDERVMYQLIEGNTIETNKESTFILNPTTVNNNEAGKIIVNSVLDYEEIKEYHLTVRAELSGDVPLASEIMVHIKLIDVNDEIPLFNVIEQASVLENEPNNTEVVKFVAVDKDRSFDFGRVYYNITEGYEYFSIDENDGVLRTKMKFDREDKTFYRVTIEARDGAPSARPNVIPGSPNKNFKQHRITIGDQNDNPPKFEKELYEFKVKENEDIQHKLGIVTATDPDESSHISYQLTEGNVGGAFGVYSDTGLIYVAGSIDYEQRRKYELTLTASDSPYTSETKIIIDVEDMNDLPPKFEKPTYDVTLVEEEPSVPKAILKVAAVDGDKNRPENKIVYYLSGPGTAEPELYFSIDKNTGDISVLKPLDRDPPNGRPEWRFTVVASDEGGGQGSLSGYSEIIVSLLDINDNDPVFKSDTFKGYVTENNTAGEFVTQIEAEDYDGNANLVYEITRNAYDENGKVIFIIDSKDGTIRSNVCCLDREKINKYIILVTVSDGDGRNATTTVTIDVKDINDSPPKFNQQQYILEIDETSDVLPPEPILVVKVLDEDHADSNTNYFTIVDDSGPGRDKFVIVRRGKDEAELKIHKALDYEDPEQRKGFHFKIQVDDLGGNSGDPDHTATADVKITLRDINDNSPEFKKNLIIVNVTESDPERTIITRFNASDKDNDGNSKVRYEIDRVTNRGRHFSIDDTGTVRILQQLDREENPVYNIRILAVDDGVPPRTSTATLKVVVADENDNPPTFCEEYYGYVKENSEGPFPEKVLDKNGNVLIIRACDLDDEVAGNGPPFEFNLDSFASEDIKTSFSVETENKNGGTTPIRGDIESILISISPLMEIAPKREFNGIVYGSASVNTLRKLDREKQKEYRIPITIKDSGTPQQTGTNTLTVVIKDENDNPMTDGTTNILIYNFKGKIPAMVIGRVYANDLDDDDWDDKTFTYVKTDEHFSVDRDTGEITIMNGTREGTYVLQVSIHDNVRGEDAQSVVTIRLETIPEEAVYKSGSIRIKGMSEKEFISIWDYKEKKLVKSKRELLGEKIAEIVGAQEKNVQVFTAMKSKHAQMLDVRFAVHGSPYYSPERINGLLSEHRGEVESTLGFEIVMIGIDECLYENVNCKGSCTNDLIISEQPSIIISPRTAFVGVNASIQALCKCKAREDFVTESCKPNPCYNKGECIMGIHGVRCICSKGFDGPRCQQTTRSFSGNSYAWFPPLHQCENSHLSLEFLTTKDDGLLFYNGPITEPDTKVKLVQDFISLELNGAKPRLLIDFGSGTQQLVVDQCEKLSDGNWHRIDIYWWPKLITLVVDMCENAIVGNQNEDTIHFDKCKAEGEPIKLNEYLNVNSPLQLGGVHHQPLKNYSWLHQHTRKGFNGCIRNFIHNSEMYDLQIAALEMNSAHGCPETEKNCKTENGEPVCINGVCDASINTFRCLCKPGFFGNKCEFTTSPSMFNNGSYVKYRLLHNLKSEFVSKIQLNYHAHFPFGEIMHIKGENKAFMVLEIENSTLQFRYSLNSERVVNKSVSLAYFNASDEYWHTVNVARYGTSVILYVDNGEGRYYNESTEFDITSEQFIKVLPDGIVLGGHLTDYDGKQVNDLDEACIDDVRYTREFHHFPMPPSERESQYAKVENFTNVDNGCNISSCLDANCPPLMQCIKLFFNYECRCIAGYEMTSDMKCIDVNECDENPLICLNGGICHNTIGSFMCQCLAPYTGIYCEVQSDLRPETRFAAGGLAAFLVCFFIILILLLVVIIHKKRQKPKPVSLESKDDVRENLIHYSVEGGGESDANEFDLKLLKIPAEEEFDSKPSKPISEVDAFRKRLDNTLVNNGIDSDLPLDYFCVYAYEGEGSVASSLSSLASYGDKDEDFQYLSKYGPAFKELASIYCASDDDDEV